MKLKMTVGALLAGLIAAPAFAGPDEVTLTGTIRDFHITHPDFESYPNTSKMNIVAPTLDKDGKPQLHSTKSNWSGAVYSTESFAQWFRDVPGVNTLIPYSITLKPHPEKAGVYFFAKDKVGTKTDYFFPIDDRGFGLSKVMNGKKFIYYTGGNTANHNFHFTYELRTLFSFTPLAERDLNGDGKKGQAADHLVFTFKGDDDVWVYINGKLAVDLGGVHSQETGTFNVDTGEFKRYGSDGKVTHTKTVDLGLVPGKKYELALFFAERCTTESNFRIETTMLLTQPGALYD